MSKNRIDERETVGEESNNGLAFFNQTIAQILSGQKNPDRFFYEGINEHRINKSMLSNKENTKDQKLIKEIIRQVSDKFDYESKNKVQTFESSYGVLSRTRENILRIVSIPKFLCVALSELINTPKTQGEYEKELEDRFIANDQKKSLIDAFSKYGLSASCSKKLTDLFVQIMRNGFGGMSLGKRTIITSSEIPNPSLLQHEQIHGLESRNKGFLKYRYTQLLEASIRREKYEGLVKSRKKIAMHGLSGERQTYPFQYSSDPLESYRTVEVEFGSKEFRQETVDKHYELILKELKKEYKSLKSNQSIHPSLIKALSLDIRQLEGLQLKHKESDTDRSLSSISPRLDWPKYDKDAKIKKFIISIFNYIKKHHPHSSKELSSTQIQGHIKEYVSQYGRPEIDEQVYFYDEYVHNRDIVITALEEVFEEEMQKKGNTKLNDKNNREKSKKSHPHLDIYFKTWIKPIIDWYHKMYASKEVIIKKFGPKDRIFLEKEYNKKVKKELLEKLDGLVKRIHIHMTKYNMTYTDFTNFDLLEENLGLIKN